MHRSRYQQIWDGEWYPLPKSWDLACCDCNLVHGITIRVRDGKAMYQMVVNKRATAALRRHRKKVWVSPSKPTMKR